MGRDLRMTETASVEHDERHSQTTDEPNDQTEHPAETARGAAKTARGAPENGDRLPYDVVFGLLSNERRRRTLTYLADGENPMTLSDLAEHIAGVENEKPVRALSSSERKCVYVALYQCHLPKMDDANVIDYDQSRGTVALRPETDQLLRHLPDDSEEANQADTGFRVPVLTSLLAFVAGLRGRVPV